MLLHGTVTTMRLNCLHMGCMYCTAQALKASIERLKVVGQKIAQLEARKRAAVEKEDYDTAKLIKADIDKLRSAGEGAAMQTAGGGGGGKNPDEIFNRVLKGGVRNSINSSQGGAPGGGGAPVPFDDQPVRPASNQRPPSGGGAMSPGAEPSMAPDAYDGAYKILFELYIACMHHGGGAYMCRPCRCTCACVAWCGAPMPLVAPHALV